MGIWAAEKCTYLHVGAYRNNWPGVCDWCDLSSVENAVELGID